MVPRNQLHRQHDLTQLLTVSRGQVRRSQTSKQLPALVDVENRSSGCRAPGNASGQGSQQTKAPSSQKRFPIARRNSTLRFPGSATLPNSDCRSPQPSAQVPLRLGVGDLMPRGVPNKKVDVEESCLAQSDASVCYLDVDVLERAHAIIEQPLAVARRYLAGGHYWVCAVMECGFDSFRMI